MNVPVNGWLADSKMLKVSINFIFYVSDGKNKAMDALLPGHCNQAHLDVKHQKAGDVEMKWAMNKPVRIGEDFDVAISITNNSKEERTVSILQFRLDYGTDVSHVVVLETNGIGSQTACGFPTTASPELRFRLKCHSFLGKNISSHRIHAIFWC